MENYRVAAALTFDSKLTHRVLETHTLYLFPWKLLREFVQFHSWFYVWIYTWDNVFNSS